MRSLATSTTPAALAANSGTRFTCFASTKVQILAAEVLQELRGFTPKSSHSTSSVLSNVHFASELSSLDDAEDSGGLFRY